MDAIDWDDLDLDQWDDRRTLDQRIARAIGWSTQPRNAHCWFDERGEFTGYYLTGKPSKILVERPLFAPTDDLAPAILAAERMARKRGATFSLDFSPASRRWRAEFQLGKDSPAFEHAVPTMAICGALCRVTGIRTVNDLFRDP